jgi:hypothetical protein
MKPSTTPNNNGAPISDAENERAGPGNGHEEPKPLTPSKIKATKFKEKLSRAKHDLQIEKEIKRKLYKGLLKLSSELKDAREECKQLKQRTEEGEKNWYEGGMWRGPELLPGIRASARQKMITGEKAIPEKRSKDAVSLSDLFFDLVIVIQIRGWRVLVLGGSFGSFGISFH